MTRIPVLLDTDIGSDIDDAVALSYLLCQPGCELLGVTTVTGDVQQRAALAEILCRTVDRVHVPIHCGRRNVLVNGPGQPNVPQYEAVKGLAHRLDRPENTAVEFLRRTIRSRPHEIVLLTIGPYSNAAALFAEDPEIPHLLKGIVSMGGVFDQPGRREWNALVDPVATSIVYAADRPGHLTVGLNVTEKCRMPAEEVRGRFVKGPLKTVALMAEKWFEHTSEVTFHDPLAATLIFHPGLCAYSSGRITVPLSEDAGQGGLTQFAPGAGPDRIATSVDSDAFFKEYFGVF
jgi:purine nucleosidase